MLQYSALRGANERTNERSVESELVKKKLILGAVLAFKTRINEACQKDIKYFAIVKD